MNKLETKQLTAIAQDKMNYDDMFLVFPSFMMDIPFDGMSDMADGQGGYLTANEMSQLSGNNWTPTKLTDDLMLCMYSFDGDDEKDDVTLALTSKDLVNIRAGRKIQDVTYEELVPNGFIICTKREINKLQSLVQENATIGV